MFHVKQCIKHWQGMIPCHIFTPQNKITMIILITILAIPLLITLSIYIDNKNNIHITK